MQLKTWVGTESTNLKGKVVLWYCGAREARRLKGSHPSQYHRIFVYSCVGDGAYKENEVSEKARSGVNGGLSVSLHAYVRCKLNES